MELNWELILTAVSLAITLGIGVFTLIINHKISKINNIKDIHTYQKHITPFELQFRDEDWLYDLIVVRDEFDHYDKSSQQRIIKWFEEYVKTHELKKFKLEPAGASVEESKTEDKPEDKTDKKDAEPKKNTKKPVKRGRKKKQTPAAEVAERLLDDSLRTAAILRMGCQGPTGETKSSATLHEIKIGTNTLRPIKIITALEDEFDIEDK